ncbi:hypothetical protein G9A89_000611, partial [Geosiphon pyriformis]
MNQTIFSKINPWSVLWGRKEPMSGKTQPHKVTQDESLSSLKGLVTGDMRCFLVWIRQSLHWVHLSLDGATINQWMDFVKSAKRILDTRGVDALIQILKVGGIAVRKQVAGEPLQTTHELGRRIRLQNGIPVIIPRAYRKGIRQGNTKMIRLVLTILSLYKGITGTWKHVDLSQISKFPCMNPESLKQFGTSFVPIFMRHFLGKLYKGILSGNYPTLKYATNFMPLSSGPHSSISFLGMLVDCFCWLLEMGWDPKSECLPVIVSKQLGGGYGFGHWLGRVESVIRANREQFMSKVLPTIGKPFLARLHYLPEKAGKVRVIAILDFWSQWALRPLHDFLFTLLKALPEDGTFDQRGAAESLIQQVESSAATDTLPYKLGEILLAFIFGPETSASVFRLLRDRYFHVPAPSGQLKGSKLVGIPSGVTTIRWETGQPMGAYSSFAILALTHHALVQYSAFRVLLNDWLCEGIFVPPQSYKWFGDYRVLGDDLVIACPEVAAEYLKVMGEFGVPISKPKSYTSNEGFMEFAAKAWKGGVELSPASFKDALVCHTGPTYGVRDKVAMSLRLIQEGWLSEHSNLLMARLRLFLTPHEYKEIEFLRTMGIKVKSLLPGYWLPTNVWEVLKSQCLPTGPGWPKHITLEVRFVIWLVLFSNPGVVTLTKHFTRKVRHLLEDSTLVRLVLSRVASSLIEKVRLLLARTHEQSLLHRTFTAAKSGLLSTVQEYNWRYNTMFDLNSTGITFVGLSGNDGLRFMFGMDASPDPWDSWDGKVESLFQFDSSEVSILTAFARRTFTGQADVLKSACENYLQEFKAEAALETIAFTTISQMVSKYLELLPLLTPFSVEEAKELADLNRSKDPLFLWTQLMEEAGVGYMNSSE